MRSSTSQLDAATLLLTRSACELYDAVHVWERERSQRCGISWKMCWHAFHLKEEKRNNCWLLHDWLLTTKLWHCRICLPNALVKQRTAAQCQTPRVYWRFVIFWVIFFFSKIIFFYHIACISPYSQHLPLSCWHSARSPNEPPLTSSSFPPAWQLVRCIYSDYRYLDNTFTDSKLRCIMY